MLDVYDESGKFVTGLKSGDLTLSEDGGSPPVNTLTESAAAVQLVVAINPGPSLAVRDGMPFRASQRSSRRCACVEAQPSESSDDLSLISLSGSLITHAKPRDWFISLDAFKPDFRNTTPNLQTLRSRSIRSLRRHSRDETGGPFHHAAYGRPDHRQHDRAADPERGRFESARLCLVCGWRPVLYQCECQCVQVAGAADGRLFFTFSGAEPFPDLDVELAALRHIYELTYTSAVTTPGEHALGVEVNTPQGTTSSDQTFSVDVQPPNPILVAPPLQIKRQPSPDDPYNEEALLPAKQTIEILVEFPDGHVTKRTALLVDGQMVDENTSEPFESFTWDLRPYGESGQHEIIVEAEDVLGLQNPALVFLVVPDGHPTAAAYRRSSVVTATIW